MVEKHYNNFRDSLLGNPVQLDWESPAYKGRSVIDEKGIRWFKAADGQMYDMGKAK